MHICCMTSTPVVLTEVVSLCLYLSVCVCLRLRSLSLCVLLSMCVYLCEWLSLDVSLSACLSLSIFLSMILHSTCVEKFHALENVRLVILRFSLQYKPLPSTKDNSAFFN